MLQNDKYTTYILHAFLTYTSKESITFLILFIVAFDWKFGLDKNYIKVKQIVQYINCKNAASHVYEDGS